MFWIVQCQNLENQSNTNKKQSSSEILTQFSQKLTDKDMRDFDNITNNPNLMDIWRRVMENSHSTLNRIII